MTLPQSCICLRFCLENKNAAWLILKTIAYTYSVGSDSSSSSSNNSLRYPVVDVPFSILFQSVFLQFSISFILRFVLPSTSTSVRSHLFCSFSVFASLSLIRIRTYFHALSIYMRRMSARESKNGYSTY